LQCFGEGVESRADHFSIPEVPVDRPLPSTAELDGTVLTPAQLGFF
jgi:hypothetical protein